MSKTPLKPSPIEVVSQDFWEVNLLASTESEHDIGDIDIEREVHAVKGTPLRWCVYLQIKLLAVEGKKPPPYTGRILARGIYEVHDQYPLDPERLARITGASMLYGAAREMVTTVTARGPHGMLTLPSVSFFENAPKEAPAKKAAKKSAKKTAKAKG